MNLTYVPSLTVSGSEGSRPGPWAPAANRLRRSRKKVIYSLGPAVSRTFFWKVSSSRPRAPPCGPLADSVPPLRGRPLVRRLSYNTPLRGDCKGKIVTFFNLALLFCKTPGQQSAVRLKLCAFTHTLHFVGLSLLQSCFRKKATVCLMKSANTSSTHLWESAK